MVRTRQPAYFLSRTNLQNTTALVEILSRLTENGNHLSLLTDSVDPGGINIPKNSVFPGFIAESRIRQRGFPAPHFSGKVFQ